MVGLDWLPQTAYLYLLVFARVGTMLMLIPGLGEQIIPPRLKLSLALAITLVFLPLLSGSLGTMPTEIMPVLAVLAHELLVGLILGGITRLIMLATQVAGAVIAYQSGLSFAQSADPSQGGVQGAVVGTFLGMLGVALIFATDLHHMALAAIYESYAAFSPTTPIMFDDAARMAINAIAAAFTIGIQMSAPFIVFGLVFNIGLAILSRLMPQLQVFFIAMPANIIVGLILFAMLLTTMMGWYLTHFEAQLAVLRGA